MAKKGKKGALPKGRVPPPFPLALVVCDAVHRDPGSGKPYLLGCFSCISARKFPAKHVRMCLYVELTNGRGKVEVKGKLVDVGEERDTVWEDKCAVDFVDPRVVVQVSFRIADVIFPQPGEYRIQLSADGEFLMERRILVSGVAAGDDEEETPEGEQDE